MFIIIFLPIAVELGFIVKPNQLVTCTSSRIATIGTVECNHFFIKRADQKNRGPMQMLGTNRVLVCIGKVV